MNENPLSRKPDPFRPVLGVGLFALGYYVLLNIFATAAQFIGRDMVAQTVPPLIAACAIGALAMAIFESKGLRDLGLHWLPGSRQNLLTGLAIGILSPVALIAGTLLLRIAHFESIPHVSGSPRAALFTLLLLLAGSAGEEITFRGFPMQFLMRGYGASVGILTTGIIFGLLHSFNPGATPLAIANTAGFGVLFGFAFLRSHDLWLPIGLHFGWNAALPFLGVELSGFTIQVVGYRLVWNAGDLWSGGTYGPEGSVLVTLELLVLFLVVRKIPVRRGTVYLIDTSPEESLLQY